MDTSFERGINASDEWYTPKEIVDACGKFDLDPCSPKVPLYEIAETWYSKEEDGLSKQWFGRVFLNPPYSRPLVDLFVKRMCEHNRGIALLYTRFDTSLFQDHILKSADCMLLIRGRVRFVKPNGEVGGTPGCGSVLIGFGDESECLRNSGIQGTFVKL